MIIFLSTLHHLDTFSTDEKLNVIRIALGNALSVAVSGRLRSASTAVLKGGWRLPLETAYQAMVETYEASQFHRQGRTLNVCNLIESEYDRLVAVNPRFSIPLAK